NSIGADELSAIVAAKLANNPMPATLEYAVAADLRQGLRDPKLTPYTAVIVRKASDPMPELQLEYVQGPGVAPLMPRTRVQLLTLLPDRTTLAVPARVASRG